MIEETAPARALPLIDSSTQPYWAALREGRLLVQKCPRSGRLQWPPRPQMLPNWTDGATWTEIEGTGTIYTFSVIHRSSHKAPPVPYVLAVVELSQGVFFTTNIIGIKPSEVRIGMRVEVTFETVTNEVTLPLFRPRPA